MVLDATTGQNAIEQAKHFTATTDVTGIALTKLDGSAKGGVVLGISDQFKIPIKYIGVGEGMEQLQVFNKKAFVDSLFHEMGDRIHTNTVIITKLFVAILICLPCFYWDKWIQLNSSKIPLIQLRFLSIIT